MPYKYRAAEGDGHNELFANAPDHYPTLVLDVARWNCEPHPAYNGASNLANFVLRRAMDQEEAPVRDQLERANLQIAAEIGNTALGKKRQVTLRIQDDQLALEANNTSMRRVARWRLEEGTYTICNILEQDLFLFPSATALRPLEVYPHTYSEQPSHQTYLRNPALRFGRAFWQEERAIAGMAVAADLPGNNLLLTVQRVQS